MGVIGGTLTGPLIFILPPLFYTKMLSLEKKHDQQYQCDEKNGSDFDLSDTNLLLKTVRYGTVQQQPKSEHQEIMQLKGMKLLWKVIHSECLLSVIVIIFGVCATLTSTFYNALDVKGLGQFWSPCLQNISLSYKMLAL